MNMEDRIDLTQYLKNKDKPNGVKRAYGWCGGDQLYALEYYLSNAKILWSFKEDDYQGDCFAIFKLLDTNKYILWRDWFGSCSGCDGLEDENGYEYIKNTLQEGNTKQFNSISEIVYYLENSDKFDWKKIICYIDDINKIKEE